MWPLPPIKNTFVSIIATPEQLVCCSLKQSNKRAPFLLTGYQRIPLHKMELAANALFNPTAIAQHIKIFLSDYNHQNAFVSLAITSPHINEQYIVLPHASPTPDQFDLPHKKHVIWDYQYLYPNEEGKFVFYVCSMQRPLLLQYQLLAHNARINLTDITTQHIATLQLYRYFYGPAFRQTQLAVDISKYNNDLSQFFTRDALARILHIPTHITIDPQIEKPFLLPACGLFVTQKELV
jgi:hypothetical protein